MFLQSYHGSTAGPWEAKSILYHLSPAFEETPKNPQMLTKLKPADEIPILPAWSGHSCESPLSTAGLQRDRLLTHRK